MSKFRRNSLKYSVNEEFFKKWSSQMAYVLGFTFADGNIYKTSLGWDIQRTDVNVLEKIGRVLNSTYPIKQQRKSSYRLRINNQILIQSAIKRGLVPKKSLRLKFPKIPQKFIRHFIRGYLDGDGWITHRTGMNEVDLGLVCGNRSFLSDLSEIIRRELGIFGKVRTKNKVTPHGVISITYLLEYFSSNAALVVNWLYGDLQLDDIYLERKYKKYLDSREVYDLIWSKFKGKSVIQRTFGKSIDDLLSELFCKKRLNGVEIAKYLGTSKSSVYRWLESTNIKYSN